jgi:hypothetical protein
MRVSAILLILALATTIVAGAQCVVSCVRPVSPPPCHHSPEKSAKICDSNSVFGEKPAVTALAPSSAAVMSVGAPEPPAHRNFADAASVALRLYPSGKAAPPILRI